MTIKDATTAGRTLQSGASLNGRRRMRGLVAAASAALLAGACSGDLGLLASSEPPQATLTPASATASKADTKAELNKAIAYWAEEHKKKPTDLKAGISYSRNLKAAGHKNEAFAVLQSLSLVHGDSKELASEYGRLALDLGQVQIAQQLLAMADDPIKPDWRVISAMGTVQAKQGKYAESIPYYERALQLAPDQTSVLNNLAMAHAANGEPAKAEDILRQVAAKDGDSTVRQNLALVLGLQSKHDDAKQVAAASDLPPGAATANTEFVRRMVKPPMPAVQEATMSAPIAAPATSTGVMQVKSGTRPKTATTTASANATAGKKPGLRDSAGPNAVGSPAGSWDTTVARAQ